MQTKKRKDADCKFPPRIVTTLAWQPQLSLGTRWVDLIAGRPASQPPGPGQTRYSESFAIHISLQTEHPPEQQSRRRRGKKKTDIYVIKLT